jgi:hypothetical protein
MSHARQAELERKEAAGPLFQRRYGRILLGMAVTSIKSTYALDVGSVRTLERMARRWKVPKSEALQRAIHAAAGEVRGAPDALAALDALQRAMRLTPAKAAAWARRVREERRTSDPGESPSR